MMAQRGIEGLMPIQGRTQMTRSFKGLGLPGKNGIVTKSHGGFYYCWVYGLSELKRWERGAWLRFQNYPLKPRQVC